jgi:hypothetical protein
MIVSHHNFNFQNFRGQGYDGSSNTRVKFDGLQTLILKECPYACYVHCMIYPSILVFFL